MTPFHRVYDSTIDCYRITEVGLVTSAETLELFELLREDVNKAQARSVLVDASQARTNISLLDIPSLVKHAPLGPAEQKTAVVLRPGFLAGLHIAFINLMGQADNIRVFYTVSDALAWLEVIA